jgi:hypothetical protein
VAAALAAATLLMLPSCTAGLGALPRPNEYAGLMHQGVNLSAIMSIFAPVSDNVQNEQCRRDSHLFLHELHKFTLWATQSESRFLIFGSNLGPNNYFAYY